MDGGYDLGYKNCSCFWGDQPGSLVHKFLLLKPKVIDIDILDAGCGEGKNSIYFARKGAKVKAIDVSQVALANAKKAWKDYKLVDWICGDIRTVSFSEKKFDLIVMYGLLHCLEEATEIKETIQKMQELTKFGGHHIICSFNKRSQDLSAHPNFFPTLLDHQFFLKQYKNWRCKFSSDEDLHEIHPHNKIPHSHSLTRLIMQKP